MAKKKPARPALNSDSETGSRAKSPIKDLIRQIKESRKRRTDISFAWASKRPNNDENALVSHASKPTGKRHIATLEEFDFCSRAAGLLFHDFGVPHRLEGILIAVAYLGPIKADWVAPWSERMVSLLSKDGPVKPVTIRPWGGNEELEKVEWSGCCANVTAVWLIAQLWDYLFPEHPHLHRLNKEELCDYIERRCFELGERVIELAERMNRPEWLCLAAQMQIERTLLRQSFEPRWSRPGTMKDWVAWHKEAKCSGSWDTISRRLKSDRSDRYVEKLPRIKGEIILDINRLPLKMQSEEFWNSLPARTTHNSASDKNARS